MCPSTVLYLLLKGAQALSYPTYNVHHNFNQFVIELCSRQSVVLRAMGDGMILATRWEFFVASIMPGNLLLTRNLSTV